LSSKVNNADLFALSALHFTEILDALNAAAHSYGESSSDSSAD